MKTVGYAIVGTGYFGAELGRIMKTKEGAKIVAVYDPENGDAIAAELGCDNESSLKSICARPDVDAVIVATPNYLHKEPVLEAARNHKNVFCEKPIALSYADCDEMVNTSKEFRKAASARCCMPTPPVTAGRSRSPLSAGRRSAPSPAAICITTSMSWTASSSSWDPQPVLP